MKHKLQITLAFILATALFLLIASAITIGGVFTGSENTGKAGETVDVYFRCESETGIKSMAVNELTYDESCMTFLSGEWLVNDAALKSFNAVKRTGVIAFAENRAFAEDALKLTFRINDSAIEGSYKIDLNVVAKQMIDHKESTILITVHSAAVNVVSDHTHTWDEGIISTAATCKETGVKTFTCTVCSEKKEETVPVDPSNHADYGTEIKDAKAAGCDSEGYTGNTVCKGCGAVLTQGETIPATGHQWDEGKITTAATCTTEGVKTFTCSVCEATKTEPVVIDPANHADYGTEIKDAKAVGCVTEGYTGNTVCKGCGAVLAEGEIIPAEGHKWDEGEVTTPATCTNEGIKEFTCIVCSEKRTEVISAAGHLFQSWEIIKPATATETGEETSTCSVCGLTQIRIIPIIDNTNNHDLDFLGDVDGNGKIESSDARLALRASVRLEKDIVEGSDMFIAADIDGNGKVESSDARTILRLSVRLENIEEIKARYGLNKYQKMYD